MRGRELATAFYRDAVAPLLSDVPHAAALLGDGSEVLGFDDEVSPDHDFGPRCQVFVDDGLIEEAGARLQALPDSYAGFPTWFAASAPGSPREHHVDVTTVSDYFAARLGRDPGQGWTLDDWLLTPTQRLATMTSGAVMHDPADVVVSRRRVLAWYPDDVWRYVLASAWWRVDQELPFVGRCGARGDDVGSRVVAARVGRDLMRIGFLVHRTWAPYSKWLGLAFSGLSLADVESALAAALVADRWRDREAALCRAGSLLVARTNDRGLAAAIDPEPIRFHARDIRVLPTEALTTVLLDAVTDDDVRALVERAGGAPPGAIDQAVDSVDVLTRPDRCRAGRDLVLV